MKELYKNKNIRKRKKLETGEYLEEISQNGYQGLMCPICYNFRIVKFSYTCKFTMESDDVKNENVYTCVDPKVFTVCSYCGCNRQLQIDPNIVEAISIFNKKGYKTKFCCESHGKRDRGYISFKDHTIDKYLYKLPLTWFDEMNGRKNKIRVNLDSTVIRFEGFQKEEALKDILEFAKDLPINRSISKSLYTWKGFLYKLKRHSIISIDILFENDTKIITYSYSYNLHRIINKSIREKTAKDQIISEQCYMTIDEFEKETDDLIFNKGYSYKEEEYDI